MNLYSLYRTSVYTMLVLATLILSVDATDYNQFAMLYPVGVAIAAFVAFVTVDKHPALGLNRDLANFLALGTILLAAAEYWANPSSLVIALGHWLVYLQLVKMFLPKTFEDDWFLFLLGVVQVVIGAFIGQSDHIGTLLMLWAAVSLAALGLFYLHRETVRFANRDGSTLTPAPDPRRPYPGLFNPGFVLSGALVTLFTIILGGFIFLLMPRWTGPNSSPVPGAPRHLTGFTDQVKLGQMGEILESDNLVFSVELTTANGKVHEPEEQSSLFGGVTLVSYQKGRWTRESGSSMLQPAVGAFDDRSLSVLRQKIRLESTNNEVLFALRPIAWATGPRAVDVELNQFDGTLVRRVEPTFSILDDSPKRRTGGPFDYEVSSIDGEDGRVALFETAPNPRRRRELLEMPEPVRQAILAYNRPVLEAIPERTPLRVARTLESHLRDSGLFIYSLKQKRGDPQLDPVVDFLVNRKQGHCEYYASALALMLRAEGIPTRVVNGFKGGDWNSIVNVLLVREKHAHSWVEALVGIDSREINGRRLVRPVWLTLDPTPAGQRDEVVAKVSNPPFRAWLDALRHVWMFNIIGFDSDAQERLIYAPIRWLWNECRRGFGVLRHVITLLLIQFFLFRNPGELFSVRGFFASVTMMLLLVGLAFLIRTFVGRLLRRWRGEAYGIAGNQPEVAFFLRLVRMLSRTGLERAPAETQREFARRASTFLTQRPTNRDGLATVPEQVVDAYYRVRFGQRPLPPETVSWLDQRLDDLERDLQLTG